MSDKKSNIKENDAAKAAEKEAERPKRLEDYDPDMQKRIIAEIKRSERNRKLLILAFVLLMIAGHVHPGHPLYSYFAFNCNCRGGHIRRYQSPRDSG